MADDLLTKIEALAVLRDHVENYGNDELLDDNLIAVPLGALRTLLTSRPTVDVEAHTEWGAQFSGNTLPLSSYENAARYVAEHTEGVVVRREVTDWLSTPARDERVTNPILSDALVYYAERRTMNNPKGWDHVSHVIEQAITDGRWSNATADQITEARDVLEVLATHLAQVTTTEELDALPVGSTIWSADRRVYDVRRGIKGITGVKERGACGIEAWAIGDVFNVKLPATVLERPEVSHG